eukprot:g4164.t1
MSSDDEDSFNNSVKAKEVAASSGSSSSSSGTNTGSSTGIIAQDISTEMNSQSKEKTKFLQIIEDFENSQEQAERLQHEEFSNRRRREKIEEKKVLEAEKAFLRSHAMKDTSVNSPLAPTPSHQSLFSSTNSTQRSNLQHVTASTNKMSNGSVVRSDTTSSRSGSAEDRRKEKHKLETKTKQKENGKGNLRITENATGTGNMRTTENGEADIDNSSELKEEEQTSPFVQLLPQSILFLILHYLPYTHVGVMAQVCKTLAIDLSNNDVIWQHIVQQVNTTRKFNNFRLPKKFKSWKQVFLNRPHLRMYGLYQGVESYIREKVEKSSQYRYSTGQDTANNRGSSASTSVSKFRFEAAKNLICHYFRYFRFFRNGTLQYMLSTVRDTKRIGNIFCVHQLAMQEARRTRRRRLERTLDHSSSQQRGRNKLRNESYPSTVANGGANADTNNGADTKVSESSNFHSSASLAAALHTGNNHKKVETGIWYMQGKKGVMETTDFFDAVRSDGAILHAAVERKDVINLFSFLLHSSAPGRNDEMTLLGHVLVRYPQNLVDLHGNTELGKKSTTSQNINMVDFIDDDNSDEFRDNTHDSVS